MAEAPTPINPSKVSGATEHSFTRLLPGDVATTRRRIIEALEDFNYAIVSNEPLLANRDGRFSMNVLKCALKVGISFRQASPLSTTTTFNYTIPLSMVTKGDLRTVEREAEALIALATRGQTPTVCMMCGTNNAGNSRFCRVCGAPNAGSQPAEVEVMRLTAGARAGQQTLIAGLIVILISILAFAMPLLFIGDVRREAIIWVFWILGQVIGWALLGYGILRLHRTLNPTTETRTNSSLTGLRTTLSEDYAALPPQSAWSSITEGTTELLDVEPAERTAVPVDRAGVDTGAMN